MLLVSTPSLRGACCSHFWVPRKEKEKILKLEIVYQGQENSLGMPSVLGAEGSAKRIEAPQSADTTIKTFSASEAAWL